MSEYLIHLGQSTYGWVVVLLSSFLPIVELRGAIPIGIALGLNPAYSTLLSIAGSILPMPIVFFIARPILEWLRNTKLFRERVDRFLRKTLAKSEKIQKYEFLGLLLFVGVPLPGTGVWTGSLIASLLGMRFKKAFWSVFLGDIMAGILVLIFSQAAFFTLRLF